MPNWSRGGRFYGASERSSRAISGRIALIQLYFYGTAAASILVSGGLFGMPLDVWQILDPSALSLFSSHGICAVFATAVAYGSATVCMPSVVQRAKLVADYAFTVFAIHLLLCSVCAGFPVSWQWWAVNVDQVLYYRLAQALDGYGYYFSAAILPVGFLVVLWPIVLYRICTGRVTKDMLAYPKWKFAALGIFDTLYNVLSTWPVPAIGGAVSNVLSQAVVPMNMGLSIAVLRTGFTRMHYVGAFMAVYGVLVRLIPSFTGSDDSDSAEGGSSSGAVFAFWCGIMVISQVPAALSNVYKEVALKGAERLDVWYTNAVISTWQLGFGLLVVPLAGLPFSPDHIDLGQLPQYVADATTCFLGTSVKAGDHCTDEDVSALALFCVFLVFNIAYNLLALAVMQEGSSALFVVASAVRLPLVDILLLWPWLAGLAAATFTVFDGFALVALLLAIYLYNADPETKSEQDPRGFMELCRISLDLVMCRAKCCLPLTTRCGQTAHQGGYAKDGEAQRLVTRSLAAPAQPPVDAASGKRASPDLSGSPRSNGGDSPSQGFYGSAADTESVSGVSLAPMSSPAGPTSMSHRHGPGALPARSQDEP
ncbi:hypothetical protein FNF27_01427 [Cafeteria roenbergensis]|uniref:Uncharacterized protein n=1 Tax=Cafeteria roenbergensis TaxID=33653 RepID=A0A5A8E467_CAFRO|nr:hypothetical protein FNF28_00161 [Cafeteria roenbergensis]KAA0177097.1 hypothetical protein FNF27_01427 [Cafeteria roenbergensis]